MTRRGCLTVDDPARGGSEPGAWAEAMRFPPFVTSEAANKPLPYLRRGRTPAWWPLLRLDPIDHHLLAKYRIQRWPEYGTNYVRIMAVWPDNSYRTSLARLIMCPPDGMVVDHINGDTFDNRRANLRICTPRENSVSRFSPGGSSNFKGVCLRKGRWRAAICGKDSRQIGLFETEMEAALAYDAAARLAHGEFASLNFPQPGERSALRSQGPAIVANGEAGPNVRTSHDGDHG